MLVPALFSYQPYVRLIQLTGKYVNKPWNQYASLVVPLYQENGVYNLYVKLSADLNSTETASAVSAGLSGNQAVSAARAGLSVTETAGAPASFAVDPQVRSATECPAELAANEATGEHFAPDTDMPAGEEKEDGLGKGFLAKVFKGPEQPTAADVEQHEAQGHLPYRRWCPQCVSATTTRHGAPKQSHYQASEVTTRHGLRSGVLTTAWPQESNPQVRW
eukprot:2754893-Amphidinium_carterae.1